MRARQRTITALDGAGDQGLWLVPNRRFEAAVPPLPPWATFSITPEIFSSATNFRGWQDATYGGFTPIPYVLTGYTADGGTVRLVNGNTAGSVANMGLTAGASPPAQTQSFYLRVGTFDPILLVSTNASSWAAYAAGWAQYVGDNAGVSLPGDIYAGPTDQPATANFVLSVGSITNERGFSSTVGGGYGTITNNQTRFLNSAVIGCRAIISTNTIILTFARSISPAATIRLTFDAQPAVTFTLASATTYQRVDATSTAYLDSKVGQNVNCFLESI